MAPQRGAARAMSFSFRWRLGRLLVAAFPAEDPWRVGRAVVRFGRTLGLDGDE